ncbi:hypothetical protein KFL_006910020 [Klebsormidium nitens]|uniref:Inward rectifier potassium channel C-terminal domain-containing protein n=1 Tax=Klebsormidium nitens TaxID=105231 RepID=A0A1Y1IRT3_KLENI|nr:hypothetical protein KFL_006910020 [Klebsormidium nitens]|eukprot:GAQ90838.1 hypothetical protein KFL_006910020 [Klebsormidium nitens]
MPGPAATGCQQGRLLWQAPHAGATAAAFTQRPTGPPPHWRQSDAQLAATCPPGQPHWLGAGAARALEGPGAPLPVLADGAQAGLPWPRSGTQPCAPQRRARGQAVRARASRVGGASGVGQGVRQSRRTTEQRTRRTHPAEGQEQAEPAAAEEGERASGAQQEGAPWGGQQGGTAGKEHKPCSAGQPALAAGGPLSEVRGALPPADAGQDAAESPSAAGMGGSGVGVLAAEHSAGPGGPAHMADPSAGPEQGTPEVGLGSARGGVLRGRRAMAAVEVRTGDPPWVALAHNAYVSLLQLPGPQFALAAFLAPLALSAAFSAAYLLHPDGLTLNGTGLRQRQLQLQAHHAHMRPSATPAGAAGATAPSLKGEAAAAETPMGQGPAEAGSATSEAAEWEAGGALGVGGAGALVFRVLMFSVALSTGLQPEVVPATPAAAVLANLNALLAQLLFVFLSGAVFARLSQPARPIRPATVAVVTPPTRDAGTPHPCRLLMARFVLAGAPKQRCELIDAKLDFTLGIDTRDAAGHHFRAQKPLKLMRAEVAHLQFGFNVRHVVDEASPLAHLSPRQLQQQDACLTLSVVGVERASLQTVFHSQQYFFADDEVVWDAEYEDIILQNSDGVKICDHTKLNSFRTIH